MKRYIFFAFLLAFSSFSLCAHETNLIDSFQIKGQKITVVPNKAFKQRYLRDDFFVEYPPEIDLTKLDYSILTMPFLLNVISIVWLSGEIYYIDSMDSDLYFSLLKIHEVFRVLYPTIAWNGQLIPKTLINNQKNNKPQNNDDCIATCFSHGLDSLCTSFRHSDKHQLLITAWGHFDTPLKRQNSWNLLKNRIELFAKERNYDICFFKSNYHDIFNNSKLNFPEMVAWRTGAVEGLGWAGLAAPILVSKEYPKLVIASSISYDTPFVHAANPGIDNNISFAGVSVEHDAFEFARVDKNEYITQFCRNNNIQELFIRVCHGDFDKNCCKCEKCLRTILGFMVIGDNFSQYGFNISEKEAIKKLKKLLEKKRSPFIIGHFQSMQKKALKYLNALSPSIKPFIKWFISLDLNKKIKPKFKVPSIDWQEYRYLWEK